MTVSADRLRTGPSWPGDDAEALDLRRCITTGPVLSRQTGYDAELTRAALPACRDACRRCAEECERHAEMHEQHCRVCAGVCRHCEQACNRLTAA